MGILIQTLDLESKKMGGKCPLLSQKYTMVHPEEPLIGV